LSNAEMVRAAWASAVTFRDTDYRGGANGARLRLAPQNGWEVNNPDELSKVMGALEGVQSGFNKGSKTISMADLIVLAGATAIEDAAKAAGHSVSVPFMPGRGDASQEQTDVTSFAMLQPAADGFRNYYSDRARLDPAEMLVDRADMLTLTVPEMTALIGGLRALDANVGGAKHGVFTDRPGTLSNDFFVNLLDMSTQWAPSETDKAVFEGKDRDTGAMKWTATEVDLVFGSNSELRAVAETYAFDGAEKVFVNDFVKAWNKVMMLDRFDVK
jgi:catalase-peroxidase